MLSILSSGNRKTLPLLYTGDILVDFRERFYYSFKKYSTDPTLSGNERLFMTYVDLFDKETGGLYASNGWFRKELLWKERKTTDIISKLLKKKRIMIKRNCANSPERHIFLYNQETINAYKQGIFPNGYVLDFVE